MKFSLKILLFIFTMFIPPVGEVESSTGGNIHALGSCSNSTVETTAIACSSVEYSPFNVGDLIGVGLAVKAIGSTVVKSLASAVLKDGAGVVAREGMIMGAGESGTTVIGEGMKRVGMEAANRPGSTFLNNMPTFTGTPTQVTSQMMTYNRQWILQQMRNSKTIIDIGLDPVRTNPSIFYQMEQNMMKNYLKLHPNAFQIIRP